LIKVMNLVSVLVAPAVVAFSLPDAPAGPFRYAIAVVALAVVVTAVVVSKRRSTSISDAPAESTVG
jgi:K(+)-stimulated pyrophosphate-energized sodium pump